MFHTTDRSITEKICSLERQLTATQLKLHNVCRWIQVKFGEDPSLLSMVESKLVENVQGAVYKVHQFSSLLDPAPIDPAPLVAEADETEIKIEEGDITVSTIYNLISEDAEQDNEFTSPEILHHNNSETTSTSSPSTVAKKRKGPPPKTISGYILFASQVRKTVQAENPEESFGEISRIIGRQWRSKTTEDKNFYENQARELNRKAELASNNAAFLNSKSDLSTEDFLQRTLELKINPDWIFNCSWEGCDLEFEDAYDVIIHCTNQPDGHACLTYVNWPSELGFQCKWRKCARVQRAITKPFKSLNLLLKHIQEYHILTGNGREVPPHRRSSNTLPSGRELFTPLPKMRKRKIATYPGMHNPKFIPLNQKFRPTEIEGEGRFTSFEEENYNLSDPLQLAPESTVKHEWEFGVEKEEPCDVQGQPATVSEIFLVDMKHLIPTSEFSNTKT